MTEEQFREQLVDYLYGELEGVQREAFEEALKQPERRAELEAMRATLHHARTGFSALEEEPPARLRGAILDAERASKVIPLKPWYRRASTITPALAAAAALTFAVLAPRRDEQPRFEAPPPAPTVTPYATPSVVAEPERAAAPAEAASKGQLDELASRGQPEEAKDEAKAKKREPQRARRSEVRFAPPPPGWGATQDKELEAPASAPSYEPSRDDSFDGLGRAGGGVAEGAAPRAPAPKAAKPASSAGPEKRSQSAAPATADAGTNRAPEQLVERAHEHMVARRWSEAVIAYRELLQRFPKDERAASWRSELGSAARALTAVQNVP